ncbi:MAG: bifunctional phosphoribosylaminoimidazolecarboxamide formyltransferase/IMP cyclohydrolase [Saprospiraceae bacterium]|nr:bifunctional phosphoribosylaminoimidazolecarboxamide formyltransferase/IMP cyclohydrolase [Saprospiraceae bacterium]
MDSIRINSALISVFNKDGLEPLIRLLHDIGVVIYSTGGTQEFIESLGLPVVSVETITGYPSILGGRVKTLHPKVFGGILAIRNQDHLSQLAHFEIPSIDLVVVDLYPFEETLAASNDEDEIIEKIDIGGISLIRAAAKNFKDVVVIPSRESYPELKEILQNNGITQLSTRKKLAKQAFVVSSHYDGLIRDYFANQLGAKKSLRYGENPHQKAWFEGDLGLEFLHGKELSYNNLLDVDAAMELMNDFKNDGPCIAVLKHNNVCGIAVRNQLIQAWHDALAGDPVSAFGGIIVSNQTIDYNTAIEIDKLFYEVLIAPDFDPEAFPLLSSKKSRILLKIKHWPSGQLQLRTVLNGTLTQDKDHSSLKSEDLKSVTQLSPSPSQVSDLLFAARCTKHLKSNAIAIVKDQQLIGMGCGQTSRIDACRQAIQKANAMGFATTGSVMSSEAFFPFPDSVELAAEAGISAIVQPGGSVNDQKVIARADELKMCMVFSGIRQFKH